MPLYEYECENCGHRFEVIQKFSDTPLLECTKCKGTLRKLFSSPAIQFKGSGWYITDYAKKNTGSGASKGEGSAAGDKPSTGDSSSTSTTSDSASKSDSAAPKTSSTPSS